MARSNGITYDLVNEAEVNDAYALESRGYPADEAASLDTLRMRQSVAPALFLGAFHSPRTLVAFITATQSASSALTHASMSTHEPGAPSVCIHSVCVAPDQRRKGVARALLAEYIDRLRGMDGMERALLLTHEEVLGLYEGVGFVRVGQSAVQHGSKPWIEMRLDLHPAPQQSLPPGIWDALQRAPRTRPSAAALSSFAGGVTDVTDPSSSNSNKYDLLCPRSGCGSVILKAGAAGHVRYAGPTIDPSNTPSHPDLPALAEDDGEVDWWRTGPTPMVFENIGFSKNVAGLVSGSGTPLQLLACAECDLGPLGWAERGGREFWIACVRVGYRV